MAITYGISGGADSAKFNIDSATGKLTFKTAPDFEAPGDANRDNIYEVQVKATDDGGASTTQDMRVTVKDVSENLPPQITSAAAVAVNENQTAVTTVTATDPDAGTPPTEPPPASGEWPNATNTGVPAGTTLTNYTGPATITTANTVVDSKIIPIGIEVTTSGVTFRKCKFTSNTTWQLNGDTARDLTVEDCEFTAGVKQILGQGKFTRLNMHHTNIAITLKDGQSTIRDCYIHDLSAQGVTDPHYDGIFISAGQRDCLIEHNLIEVPQQGGTAAIFIATRWANADIVNTTVNNNRLLGTPSYAMYCVDDRPDASVTGTKWTNNQVQRGAYGYWSIEGTTVVKSGNTDAQTGVNIDSK